jgi:hypothetical protein
MSPAIRNNLIVAVTDLSMKPAASLTMTTEPEPSQERKLDAGLPDLKTCPNCGCEHDNSYRMCSNECAREFYGNEGY